MLEQQIQLLKKLQVNSLEDLVDDDDEFEEELDAIDEDDPDDMWFFVQDNTLFQVGSHNVVMTCHVKFSTVWPVTQV
jgi:hypothetical protein